jgi:DNA-binding transcriptional ArsR family regulator
MSTEADDAVFKALADGRRRAMLDALKDGPKTTGELCALFESLDRCTVMQHLGVLERADLVVVRREGRLRWNYLNALPIKEIHDRWIGEYARGAVTLLARMQADLERAGEERPARVREERSARTRRAR